MMQLLGQSAYFQLTVFNSLARSAGIAPTLAARESLSRVAGNALATHQALAAEIRRVGGEPAEAMAPFAADLESFSRMTYGATWYESILGCYLTTGLLEDFFASLAAGLPHESRQRIVPIIRRTAGVASSADTAAIVHEITRGIAADSTLDSSLALWGRRLVGDTLLIARSALHVTGDLGSDESTLEPVFTEIIAAHTRRMDALGLTA
ncbi:ferritin-like fold-containing protein [Glaciibacter psychrotolerans]|uniref:Ferritin-like domain-containing protein n=1 Tax=Glaciibacter psychrotolerans TaxID=670054 RepID=A0A7Z0J6A5_9MICO|nr:ferritin-like fold-containing protein [Leifsonia psychrotolerans]NYJ19718.1 hypothetical protein [Leifsonia psychrotolerans]